MSTMQVLTDSFGRKHDYLRLSLTERCNLRCFYCMPEEGHECHPKSHLMSVDEIDTIARTFVNLGVQKIRLTGGEPLVRKEAREIIQRLGALPVELAITTNGVLVDQYLDTFESVGLQAVNLSLDSLDEENFQYIAKRHEMDRVLSNLELLIERGFETKVNVVVMRGVNDHEVEDFVALTREKPIQVRFIEFMPFNGNRWDWSKGVSFEEIMRHIEEGFPGSKIDRLQDKPNDTARNFRVQGFKGSFAVIASVSNPFCQTCNRIRVTADGKMKNCLFSNSETNLLSALRSGEDLEPLIRGSIMHKKAVRAGMDTFDEMADRTKHEDNRSMVAIGG